MNRLPSPVPTLQRWNGDIRPGQSWSSMSLIGPPKRLQKRIFKAAQLGDDKTVRQLQKTLLRSRSAKTIAVRQVSQDNRGRNTAGVDGIKTLTPAQRLELVSQLRLTGQAMPTRRVWIPKAGTTEKRPLGIPKLLSYYY